MKRDLPVGRGWRPATHGHLVKHRMFGTPEYAAWGAMRQRCNNPNHPRYPLYGGRGIKVCERWSDFRNFYADLGPRPDGYELDKIDNNGNYEPSNVRWTTKLESRRNRRGWVIRKKPSLTAEERRARKNAYGTRYRRARGIQPRAAA